jgi:ATP-GRASP peptide maturase of grasp-with-spasm system
MIAILSQSQAEATTALVMDWLHHLGAPHLRLNGDALNEGFPFAVELAGAEVSLELGDGDETVRGEEIDAAWFRRWHVHQNLEHLKETADPELGYGLFTFLAREMATLRGVVEEALDGARWLTRGRQASVHKFHVLRQAARAGLDVPPTLVTNRRDRLLDFRARHGRIICKPLHEAPSFRADGQVFAAYTAEVTDEIAAALPATFFPTLVQARIEKRYELRVFCLDGRCWAMAILSQGDPQTAEDFRHYNYARPNRRVPFALPEEIEARCRALMEALDLPTGSIDLIRAADGRYVFLEVNPIGQLGMVSLPCNYQLERRIAEHLLDAGRGR